MRKVTILFTICILVAFGFSCDKEADQNKYCELFSISFEGQTGDTDIDRDYNEVAFQIFTDNLSAVRISEMTLSDGATPSTAVGETLDFSNENNTADLTITSESGEKTKAYTIFMDNLAPDFVGSWKMTSGTNRYSFQVKYCDGGDCSLETSIDPAVFTNGSAAADNTINFTLDGFDEETIMYGKFTYGPGADGEMGSYEHTHATTSEVYDFNDNYGILFAQGSWELNLGTSRITFFNADRSASIKTYTNYLDKKHWIMGTDADGTTEMFTFWLPVNRSGMLSAQQAWETHGADDPTLAYIMGGFFIEFNMVKNN